MPLKTYNVLTLQQPYAWLWCAGFKPCETRSWATQKVKHGEWLLVHASQKTNAAYKALAKNNFWSYIGNATLHEGAIIGMVRFAGCMTQKSYQVHCYELNQPEQYGMAELFGDLSHEGRVAWLASEQRLFTKPIPAKGKLNVWQWTGDLAGVEYVEQKVRFTPIGTYHIIANHGCL